MSSTCVCKACGYEGPAEEFTDAWLSNEPEITVKTCHGGCFRIALHMLLTERQAREFAKAPVPEETA